jgi:hypothetical protein
MISLALIAKGRWKGRAKMQRKEALNSHSSSSKLVLSRTKEMQRPNTKNNNNSRSHK